jgi:hypothetical protein
MLYKKNGRVLDIISYLNESIDNLLEQDIIVTPYSGDKIKTIIQKFTVVENGQLPPNTDNEYFIELKDAIMYKSGVKVGDEIEIEVADLDSMKEEGILEFLKSDEIDAKTLEKIVLGQRTTIRVGGKILKYGPRSIGKLQKVAAGLVQAKKYVDKYGKKSEHSLCYCLRLFDEHTDDTTGDADKSIYLTDVEDQPDFIQEELINTWDYCENEYGSKINKKDDRQESKKSCDFLESWYEEGESILDDMISDLQKSFKVVGYNKKSEKETKYNKEKKSPAEKIILHDYVEIEFSSDVVHTPRGGTPTVLFSSGDIILFEIKKTYGSANDTVLVEHGNKKYILGFETATVKKSQSDNTFWVLDNSGAVSNIKTTWDGKIKSFRDN